MAYFETGETRRIGETAAPKDTGESFQLERIANALEEILQTGEGRHGTNEKIK